ncbi:hypothetical protein CKU38_00938 [Xanthomonas citri pv. fuscans]|nr:hypothetical protein CKU38_00938 [Xanthomonas citri pv. fuscans]
MPAAPSLLRITSQFTDMPNTVPASLMPKPQTIGMPSSSQPSRSSLACGAPPLTNAVRWRSAAASKPG